MFQYAFGMGKAKAVLAKRNCVVMHVKDLNGFAVTVRPGTR